MEGWSASDEDVPFEPDYSEDDNMDDALWEDIPQESESEEEREEAGGWADNQDYETHIQAIIVIVGVVGVGAIILTIWYCCMGTSEETNANGRKLTRKQRGVDEDEGKGAQK